MIAGYQVRKALAMIRRDPDGSWVGWSINRTFSDPTPLFEVRYRGDCISVCTSIDKAHLCAAAHVVAQLISESK